MNASVPTEVEQEDTQAIFPMPPCEVREALANGIHEAVRRSYLKEYGINKHTEDAKLLAEDLVVILFGDLNRDYTQRPRADGRFLDLQDVFKRAITLDDIAKRLNHMYQQGTPQKAILRAEPAPDQPVEGTFFLHVEITDDDIKPADIAAN